MQLTYGSALLVLSLAACGGKAKEADTAPADHAGSGAMSGDMAMQMQMQMKMKIGMAAASADSQALIAKASSYATWPRFTENSEPKASKAHMNMYVVTYHNDVVTAAIAAHTLPLPDGAVIVKQNKMKPDAPPQSLTIMSKQGGKWYWLDAMPDGKVVTINDMPQEGFGAPMCTKCHDDAANNDYVFTHSFAK